MSTEGGGTLAAALQNLTIAWQEVRTHWRDAKCQQFEDKFLKELPSRTTQATSVMADIEKIIKKARNDCA